MNNAFFFEEEEPQIDTSEEQARLTKIIEAIAGLVENKDWRTLQEMVFAKEKERITKIILSEAKKQELNLSEIYRLQGELQWAKRYADLTNFAKLLKNQLENE